MTDLLTIIPRTTPLNCWWIRHEIIISYLPSKYSDFTENSLLSAHGSINDLSITRSVNSNSFQYFLHTFKELGYFYLFSSLKKKLQFWKFREYGIPLYCHYSHVHSDTELLNQSVLSFGQVNLFKHYSYSIGPYATSQNQKTKTKKKTTNKQTNKGKTNQRKTKEKQIKKRKKPLRKNYTKKLNMNATPKLRYKIIKYLTCR